MGHEIDDERPEDSPADAETAVTHLRRSLDDLAHRFDQRDWVELAATVVLSFAVLVAAWSAYQASLWGGVQAANASEHTAQLTQWSEVTTLIAAQMETDSQMMATWLIMAADDNETGMQVLEERFNYTLRPAFDAWMASSTDGSLPPGIPMDLPEYVEALGDGFELRDLHAANATAAAEAASDANDIGDSFVLVTVIMASVMFFAGVGTKLKNKTTRIAMLVVACLLGAGAIAAMLSLPQQPVGF